MSYYRKSLFTSVNLLLLDRNRTLNTFTHRMFLKLHLFISKVFFNHSVQEHLCLSFHADPHCVVLYRATLQPSHIVEISFGRFDHWEKLFLFVPLHLSSEVREYCLRVRVPSIFLFCQSFGPRFSGKQINFKDDVVTILSFNNRRVSSILQCWSLSPQRIG